MVGKLYNVTSYCLFLWKLLETLCQHDDTRLVPVTPNRILKDDTAVPPTKAHLPTHTTPPSSFSCIHTITQRPGTFFWRGLDRKGLMRLSHCFGSHGPPLLRPNRILVYHTLIVKKVRARHVFCLNIYMLLLCDKRANAGLWGHGRDGCVYAFLV